MSSTAATPSASSLKIAGTPSGSSVEPSPASTYGGSVASEPGDGVPPTPIDDAGSMVAKLKEMTIEVNDTKTPVAIYSPPFVRNGAHGGIEDPFTSPIGRTGGQRTPTGPKKKSSRAALSDNWRSGSSDGASSDPSSPTSGGRRGNDFVVRNFASTGTSLRSPGQGGAIQSEDAQAHFAPSSCVFVANLLQSESDEALEVAVTQVFREFGTVFVKIRRDPKHMPFAFCQYTNDRDAETAIRLGRGRNIRGRPCRCEKAKAHRLFYVERKYGAAITCEEATQLLSSFGTIDSSKYPSTIERSAYNLNEGVVIQFKMYDEGQAALQAFRNHDVYKIQSMANMTSGARGAPGCSSDPAHRLYLETYELDKRSVFVGNLPVDVVDVDLKQHFDNCGHVVQVTIHKPESIIDATQKHCFAFVEFYTHQMAARAIAELNNAVFRGKALRVSQKDTEGAKSRSARRQFNRPSVLASAGGNIYQSPVATRQPTTQQMSPVTQMSPGYVLPPHYQGHWGAYNAHGQFYPYPADYSAYYYGAASPAYSGHHAGHYSGSPGYSQFGYQQYPVHPAYYSPPVGATPYYSNDYTNVANTTTVEDVRSATPTPVGQFATAEASLESE